MRESVENQHSPAVTHVSFSRVPTFSPTPRNGLPDRRNVRMELRPPSVAPNWAK